MAFKTKQSSTTVHIPGYLGREGRVSAPGKLQCYRLAN